VKIVDMAPDAIAARLQQLSELYDMSLMLRSAKKAEASRQPSETVSQSQQAGTVDPAST